MELDYDLIVMVDTQLLNEKELETILALEHHGSAEEAFLPGPTIRAYD